MDSADDQVFETFIADLRQRGIEFEMPSNPRRDANFIKLLNSTYDFGQPVEYPHDAP